MAQEIITRHLGKEPDLAGYVAERVALHTKDVSQAIQLANLSDSPRTD